MAKSRGSTPLLGWNEDTERIWETVKYLTPVWTGAVQRVRCQPCMLLLVLWMLQNTELQVPAGLFGSSVVAHSGTFLGYWKRANKYISMWRLGGCTEVWISLEVSDPVDRSDGWGTRSSARGLGEVLVSRGDPSQEEAWKEEEKSGEIMKWFPEPGSFPKYSGKSRKD